MISASISVIANVEFGIKNVLLSILSSSVIILVGISELMKFREQWMEYRTTAETIKSEKMLFLTNTGPYSQEGKFNYYVENHEAIVKSEHINWKNFFIKKDHGQ
ncbi:hypothetical protein AWN68_02670 [Roseivirga echinicomitans]|uniref:SMODS and SLOG-associating 2TM effector domain-containing protein n=2 Tax=Roseivirga echinicomitans TaxID=296218 RepID=A0A150XY88_9BACT|nr:hypothetical protein AWN68_02670 [Roseivirga echinicomitans]